MAPPSSPSFSNQSRASHASPSARRTHLNSPVCGPRFTQHPDVHKHTGSQQVLTGTAPELHMQNSGALPINLQSPPQPPQPLGCTPEHLMTRLQGDYLPSISDDVSPAQLNEIFSRFSANEAAFPLPDHDMMSPPYDYVTFPFGWATFSSYSTPPLYGEEGIQNGMANMDTVHDQRTYNYDGNTPNDMYFDPQSIDAHGMHNYPWCPGRVQSLLGSLPESPYAPRAFAVGLQDSAMTIPGRHHEATPTASAAYLPSPTLSADTRLTPSSYSPSGTPLPPPSPLKRVNKEDQIRVIDLFEKWYARQTEPFTVNSLVSFRAYCVTELTGRGHRDVSRIFSKPPKAIVGTRVSRADRLHHRLEQTQANFVCPLLGCGSQCTRMHNLNLHLGAHIGLTDRHCEGCDAYFSASSINRHKETCAGKKTQRPRRRYGAHF